jgi:hypothetical protein
MALDRSILQRVLLTVGLGLAAACATAPPVAAGRRAGSGSSGRVPVALVSMARRRRLSYVIETSIETAVAERVTTTRERHRFRMSSMGSVVSGVRRVRIAFDDVDIADALLDEGGRLKDIFVSVGGAEPMIEELRAGVVRTAQHPLQKRLESATLRIGEPFAGDVRLSEILGPLMTPTRTPESATRLAVTYTGRKRVNGGVAAELLMSYTLAPNTSYRFVLRESKVPIEVSSISGESHDYLDPDRYYRILGYDVITTGGVAVGKRWTAKQLTVTTLDRGASRGI